MFVDYYLIAAAWVITAIALIIFVPKNKIRDAWVIFMFKLVSTWPLGLLFVELKLLEYPVRLFSYANRTSFSFEYFIYPAICVIFNLHFPQGKNKLIQTLHYAAYCTGITVFEIFVKEYTNIIAYTGWTWYYTWVSLFVTFLISRMFYIWFFKINKKV